MKIIATNKKAYFNYFIESTQEAGISLQGSEVKSLRAGHISLDESFISIYDTEAYLKNAYIKAYEKTTSFIPNEKRERKLLLHKKEILKLNDRIRLDGFTLVPLKVYLVRNKAKVLIGIAKGKKTYDKRETIKQRDIDRYLKKEYKNY